MVINISKPAGRRKLQGSHMYGSSYSISRKCPYACHGCSHVHNLPRFQYPMSLSSCYKNYPNISNNMLTLAAQESMKHNYYHNLYVVLHCGSIKTLIIKPKTKSLSTIMTLNACMCTCNYHSLSVQYGKVLHTY